MALHSSQQFGTLSMASDSSWAPCTPSMATPSPEAQQFPTQPSCPLLVHTHQKADSPHLPLLGILWYCDSFHSP